MNLQSGALYRFFYNNWLEKSSHNPTATVTLKEAGSDEAKSAKKNVRGKGIRERKETFVLRNKPPAIQCHIYQA